MIAYQAVTLALQSHLRQAAQQEQEPKVLEQPRTMTVNHQKDQSSIWQAGPLHNCWLKVPLGGPNIALTWCQKLTNCMKGRLVLHNGNVLAICFGKNRFTCNCITGAIMLLQTDKTVTQGITKWCNMLWGQLISRILLNKLFVCTVGLLPFELINGHSRTVEPKFPWAHDFQYPSFFIIQKTTSSKIKSRMSRLPYVSIEPIFFDEQMTSVIQLTVLPSLSFCWPTNLDALSAIIVIQDYHTWLAAHELDFLTSYWSHPCNLLLLCVQLIFWTIDFADVHKDREPCAFIKCLQEPWTNPDTRIARNVTNKRAEIVIITFRPKTLHTKNCTIQYHTDPAVSIELRFLGRCGCDIELYGGHSFPLNGILTATLFPHSVNLLSEQMNTFNYGANALDMSWKTLKPMPF